MDRKLEQTISILFPAFEVILSKNVLEILTSVTENELSTFHFGLGLYIRNNILNPESLLYSIFGEAGFTCNDDMSALILELFHKYLHEKTDYI
jgi:hypothetical protein